MTRRPLSSPNAPHASRPHAIARYGFNPESTASVVITIEPSAITMPQERSIPAVRMISVCPIASTPTTTTCCRISERFCPVKKRSVCEAKNAHATSSARKGPNVATGIRSSSLRTAAGYFVPQHASMPNVVSLLSMPGIGLSVMSVTPVSV